jgi:hypothetical protein
LGNLDKLVTQRVAVQCENRRASEEHKGKRQCSALPHRDIRLDGRFRLFSENRFPPIKSGASFFRILPWYTESYRRRRGGGNGGTPQTPENPSPEHFLIWIKDRAAFAQSMFGGWRLVLSSCSNVMTLDRSGLGHEL